jgi:phosphotransferase system HPr (HPr) family protein
VADATTATATFAVGDKQGLHARPCARIAKAAQKCRCAVVARFDGRTADAASVLELLGLNATGGSLVEITATGRDALRCLEAIGRAITEA